MTFQSSESVVPCKRDVADLHLFINYVLSRKASYLRGEKNYIKLCSISRCSQKFTRWFLSRMALGLTNLKRYVKILHVQRNGGNELEMSIIPTTHNPLSHKKIELQKGDYHILQFQERYLKICVPRYVGTADISRHDDGLRIKVTTT